MRKLIRVGIILLIISMFLFIWLAIKYLFSPQPYAPYSNPFRDAQELEGLNAETKVSFFKDGSDIVFSAKIKGKEQVFKYGFKTQLTKRLTSESQNWAPTVSPKTNDIVFLSNRDGDSEVFIMNKDGKNERKLTDNDADDYPPSFSPDGSKIVLQRSSPDKWDRRLWRLFVIDMNTFTEQEIIQYARGRYYVEPIFLDNNIVRFESSMWIYLIDVAKREQLSKKAKAYPSYYPIYSPDRTMVAFHDYVGMNQKDEVMYEIFIADANLENRTQVTKNGLSNRPLAFSPDGKKIFFLTGRPKGWGDRSLWQIGIDGSSMTQILINLT